MSRGKVHSQNQQLFEKPKPEIQVYSEEKHFPLLSSKALSVVDEKLGNQCVVVLGYFCFVLKGV